MKSFHFALLLALGAALDAPATSCAGECPANTWGTPYGAETSTDPAHDWPEARYNLIAGTMSVSSGGGTELGSYAGILIRDLYWVVGPATAVPILFRVKLHTTGVARGGMLDLTGKGQYICSTSYASIRLSSGAAFEETRASSQYEPTCSGNVPISITQELPLLHVPNEVFEVAYNHDLRNGYGVSVYTLGEVSFEGLPPGYTIQSCQGYAGRVVPTVARSWGMLKHSYR